MFDTQTFQSLHPNLTAPAIMDAFTVIVFLVLFACCIGILGAVHNARGSSSEAEADLELGETRRAVRHEEVTGWLADTGAEPLPLYSVKDPLGAPSPYQDAVPEGDLGVFVIEDKDEDEDVEEEQVSTYGRGNGNICVGSRAQFLTSALRSR
jgi:hypothetical protein